MYVAISFLGSYQNQTNIKKQDSIVPNLTNIITPYNRKDMFDQTRAEMKMDRIS